MNTTMPNEILNEAIDLLSDYASNIWGVITDAEYANLEPIVIEQRGKLTRVHNLILRLRSAATQREPMTTGNLGEPSNTIDDEIDDETDFGQVITMDPRRFAERVFRKAASSIAHVKNNLDSYPDCECPAILGPDVLDILEACDVLRAKLDDRGLAEYLTDSEANVARCFLAFVERVRGELLTLTRSGDFPEDGVVEVIE